MSRATGAATLARSALSSFTAWVTERWSSSKVSIGARVGTKVASLIHVRGCSASMGSHTPLSESFGASSNSSSGAQATGLQP